MPIRQRLTNVANISNADLPPIIIEADRTKGIVFDDIKDMPVRAKLRFALEAIPIGQTMLTTKWNQEWVLPYLKQKFQLKNIKLAIYPIGILVMLDNKHTKVTGCQVSTIKPHPKTGMKHVIRLPVDDRDKWYPMIINWLFENNFTNA